MAAINLQEILSQISPGLPYNTPQAPMSGTDMMNGSFSEEAVKTHQQAQDNLIDQARAEAIRQDPTLNYVQRQIATGLIGAKQDWENAYQQGNATGMVNAANSANSLRQQAASIGWDPSAYGENVSLHDAAMNLANNDTRSISDMFYGSEDSGTYFRNTYNRLKKAGMDDDAAMDEAYSRAANYQSNRINNLRDAFSQYGMDSRGAINSNGMRLISMLADESKDQASLYGNMNPTPVQAWNFDNSLITAANAQENALTRMAQQDQYQTAARHEGYAHDADMLALRAQLVRESEAQKNQDNFNRTYQLYYALTGGDQEKAMQFAAQHLLGLNGGKSGNGGNGGSTGSNNKDRMDMLEQIRKRMGDIEKRYEGNPEGLAADNNYRQLQQAYSSLMFGEQEDSNTGGINLNDYNQAISYMTEMLEQNRAAGTTNSMGNLMEMFRRKGIPEEYINDVDWGHYYGSGTIEKKPTATSEAADKSELQKYADASDIEESSGGSTGIFANLWDMLTNTAAGASAQNSQNAIDRIQNPYLRERIQRQLS